MAHFKGFQELNNIFKEIFQGFSTYYSLSLKLMVPFPSSYLLDFSDLVALPVPKMNYPLIKP